MPFPNDVVECGTHNSGRDVVDGSERGDADHPSEDDGHINVLEPCVRIPAVEGPGDDGRNSAHNEEVEQRSVQAPGTEYVGGEMTPQMMEVVTVTTVYGQVKPCVCVISHIPSMLLNIQFMTPSWVVRDTIEATIWAQNTGQGGIFM